MTKVLVPSLSDPDTSYEVTRHGDEITCACPRFDFSPKDAKGCKHTAIVMQCDAMLQRCAELHGIVDAERPGLCRACLVALLARSLGKVQRGYVTKEKLKERVAATRERFTKRRRK